MRTMFLKVGPFFPLSGPANVKSPSGDGYPYSWVSLESRSCREPLAMLPLAMLPLAMLPLAMLPLLIRPTVPPLTLLALAGSNWLRMSTFEGLLKVTLLTCWFTALVSSSVIKQAPAWAFLSSVRTLS